MRSKFFLIIAVLLITAAFHLKSQTLDSGEVFKAILYVGHINDDCSNDTIIGTAKYGRGYLPRFILWGKVNDCSGIPDSLKERFTEIEYPAWDTLWGASNILMMNQDTLTDIIFYFWGRVPDGQGANKDTASAIVLFGQSRLDSISQIQIEHIADYQTTPFVAMKLRMGHELTDAKYRDISYTPTYRLNNVSIDVYNPSQDPPAIQMPSKIVEEIKPDIKIYPNPAVYYANIEINQIPEGEYTVKILTLQSSPIFEQNVRIEGSKEFIKTLDLKDIPTGTYFLQLFAEHKLYGTYKIMIVH